MIGKLDPEDRVLDDSIHDSIMGKGGWLGQLFEALQKLEMQDDELEVVIGGSQIYEIDGAGTKWAPVKGTRKYNKDAFIVIKNLDRNPTVPSQPNPDLKAHHAT